MAKTEHYYTKFEEGKFYHIYNRSVDRKPMFAGNDNYEFFLRQYNHYISPVAETFAYCLLGNHFHILIRVNNSLTPIPELTTPHNDITSNLPKTSHEIVSRQFRKFFQSYAMAFNNQQNRIGTLFQTPFKRVSVEDHLYFTHLIYYIHANPQLRGLIDDFRKWHWSSYNSILADKATKLNKHEVLNWFGNKETYKEFHDDNQNIRSNEKYIIEDE